MEVILQSAIGCRDLVMWYESAIAKVTKGGKKQTRRQKMRQARVREDVRHVGRGIVAFSAACAEGTRLRRGASCEGRDGMIYCGWSRWAGQTRWEVYVTWEVLRAVKISAKYLTRSGNSLSLVQLAVCPARRGCSAARAGRGGCIRRSAAAHGVQ